jgi:hypothetical protein
MLRKDRSLYLRVLMEARRTKFTNQEIAFLPVPDSFRSPPILVQYGTFGHESCLENPVAQFKSTFE